MTGLVGGATGLGGLAGFLATGFFTGAFLASTVLAVALTEKPWQARLWYQT